jgi:hypothetical protein
MKYIKKFNESQYQTVNFEDLVGEHMLSGVDISTESTDDVWGEDGDATVVRFLLDGITYKAIEDPSDGYRSFCDRITICNDKISNMFPEHKVIGKMNTGDDGVYHGGTNHIIEFYDAATKGVVLEIGTSNTDDYYPSAVIHWTPENLELNQAVNKYNL